MRRPSRITSGAFLRTPVVVAACLLLPSRAVAQHEAVRVGVHAVAVYERVDPAPGGGSIDEARVVQPSIMVHGSRGRFGFTGMANFEGITMPGGELAPGAWGEGFVDRRHPHTYLHEAVVTFADTIGRAGRPLSFSLTAGKGFAPFGTDDPMGRPVLRYPVNHHLAQVLERLVLVGAARLGPASVEAAIFNGDEPEKPEQWPNARRFGDSWSARVTVFPAAGIELQGSHARVAAPEIRVGQGPGATKWSVSARAERHVSGGEVYGLLEWARTEEAAGAFTFHSLLAEGSWSRGRHLGYYRFERTERPEEVRTLDPFRTARPHSDNSIVGITRWTLSTMGYRFDALGPAKVTVVPMVEASLGRVSSSAEAAFDPAAFYGRATFWSVSAGVRLGWGARLHRMGRYGAATGAAASEPEHHAH